ncbi:hypothetical protein F5879DRAFT_1050803 [Lentinula edodes]|nr:hypothetical protein F5879DRAFT_1050803 [Lentinula edodes]
MLPDSPSPMKPSNKTHLDEASMDGLVPKFELPGQTIQRGPILLLCPTYKTNHFPLDAGSFVQDDSIMSATTIEHSKVNISALEKELGNEPPSVALLFHPSQARSRVGFLLPPCTLPPRFLLDGGRGLRTSVDRQRIVDISIEHSPECEDDHKEQLGSEIDFERETEKDASFVMTAAMENSAEMATIETAEKRKVVAVGVVQEHEPAETEASMEVTHDVTIDFEVKGEELQEQAEPTGDEVDSGMDDDDDADDDNNGEEFGLLKTPAFTNSKKLKFDLGSKFGLGKLGLLDLELSSEDLTTPSTSKRSDLGFGFNASSSELPPKSVQNMPVGSVNVRMAMRNALDRLMDDVASVGGSTVEEPHEVSMTTTEEDAPGSHLMQRAATDYTLVGSLGPPPGSSVHSAMPSRNASSSSITPPPPPKDNICAREAIIIEKRQKMRRMEEGDDNDDDGPLDNYGNEDDVDFFSEGKDEETTHDPHEDAEPPAKNRENSHSTHFKRSQSARIEEEDIDRDVNMLPNSPSPMKPSNKAHLDEASMDGLVPKFELPGHYPMGSDPFAMPNLQDESLPIDAGNSMQDDSTMPATTIPVAPFLSASPAFSSSISPSRASSLLRMQPPTVAYFLLGPSS